MRAVKWFGPKDLRLTDVEKPIPRAHEALLRVESVGVCGSDMHYYLDGCIGSQVLTPPVILGHEYAGIVEAVGEAVDPGLMGRRVAVEPGIPCLRCEWCRTGHYNVCRDMFFPGGPGCDGALCEYMAVHAAFCFPVPEDMRAQTAAMIEPAAVALHAAALAALKPGETVAVLGLGPIGLLTAQAVKLCGAGTVYGTDLMAYRVAAGKRHGVDVAFDAAGGGTVEWIMEQTSGRGVDVAIDCTNRPEGLALAVSVARPAGRCVLVGISGQESDMLPVSVARRRELQLNWCRRFRDNFPATLALVAAGRLDVDSLVTHSFSLEQTAAAFELVAHNGDNVLKASIDQ